MILKRLLMTSAAVLVLAGPAFAQPASAPTSTTPPAAATAPHAAAPAASTAAPATQAARHMRDDQMRASKLIGSSIYDASDQKLGTVADLIVDRDGKIADVVLGVGGVMGAGEKHVAVPMSDLKRGKDNHLVVNATKDSLGKMANFDLTYDAAKSGSSSHK